MQQRGNIYQTHADAHRTADLHGPSRDSGPATRLSGDGDLSAYRMLRRAAYHRRECAIESSGRDDSESGESAAAAR